MTLFFLFLLQADQIFSFGTPKVSALYKKQTQNIFMAILSFVHIQA